MPKKWVKFIGEKKYHYCDLIIDEFTVACEKVSNIYNLFGVDEMINNLTHHDKCNKCIKAWEKERNDKQSNSS